MQVRHQAGSNDVAAVRERYAAAILAAKGMDSEAADSLDVVGLEVTDFIDDMAGAYRDADVVICRSGAMTVTELSALGVPSILVPFPHAVDDHQTRNAEHLSSNGAAVLIAQSALTPDVLAAELKRLGADRTRLQSMSEAARRCFVPQAAEAVADALMEVAA
jgi:UDP-N-acetylglucosamine--N-acetylmuramyl-(pentapeptide) pyrophosphoryl-undecaprenol N-acetylglucosamine transferase